MLGTDIISQREWANFFGGEIGQHNVGLTYSKNVALWCGCSLPTAEWVDLSTVGIAQPVAHAANNSILCMRGDAALPKLLWDFLFYVQIGSPTALAQYSLEQLLKLSAKNHGLYVPSGAFWGSQDIQKMADRGNLKVCVAQYVSLSQNNPLKIAVVGVYECIKSTKSNISWEKTYME